MDSLTSTTHPIRVDYVPFDDPPITGMLGMTFAPGKKQPGGHHGSWDRDLDTDLERMKREFGVDCLVSLIEDHEYVNLKIETLGERAAAHGIEWIKLPICDQSVPECVEDCAVSVTEICERICAGRNVVLHCMGGLGRTGTIAACCVIQLEGCPADVAIRRVRAARAGTIENGEQVGFVGRYASLCSA